VSLIDAYDAALFDLDGVVYLGPAAVPGAADGIRALRQHGVRVGFVTNNAARPPVAVAEHLEDLGVPADVVDIVTSAQAGARMLAAHLPAGATVLIVGTPALAAEVAAVGLSPVMEANDTPDAVIQGYDPTMTWPRLDVACRAIQGGALWFATNTDSTRPTDTGLVPGAGAQIAAVQVAVRPAPLVAGKPYPPLLQETVRRLGSGRPIFVGDRIDTDIMGANAVGMDSLFVFTGAHTKADLVLVDESGRPTHIGYDLRALMMEPRELVLGEGSARCRGQVATISAGEISLAAVPTTLEEQLDALWAVLALVWQHPGVDASVVDHLDLVP